MSSEPEEAAPRNWDDEREARFSRLINQTLTGYMHASDTRELNELKTQRDAYYGARQRADDIAAWLRGASPAQLLKLLRYASEHGAALVIHDYIAVELGR